jgi:hypothetical protein
MAIKGDRVDYLFVETECLSAIRELTTTCSVSDWISRHESLYRKIIIKPEGLPAVIDFNLGNDSFEGIRKFGRLYETLLGIFE